ncbi:hypothetical protein [Ralstonia chuxiongensis]|uniref:hypothetical protein n=1 Tax=Ralstonia chuxiongensis TaxID=2957504 RepID=UPI0028F510F5|nr:hypothetical protein [Ralstonia chuxiongensis]CAJ0779934.1 hypothetical protein R8510_04679 [Ralstonia chuxiongensis]
MPIPRKGLRDIHTRRERAGSQTQAYTAYLRLLCIEMEKSLRELERRAAQHRLAIVENRLSALEREKKVLSSTVGTSAVGPRGAPPTSPTKGGLHIRY